MPIAANIYYHAYEGGEEGERPPVVLIHGAGGTHLYWPSELRRLPGYRVFALDLPGHGKSAGRGQQSINHYAQSILDWLQAVGLHSSVFIGHSMGSAIVIELALNHSEHVLGLGLIGAGARLSVNPTLLENSASPTTFHNVVATVIEWSFSPQAPAQLTELAARRMADTRPTVLHGDFLACDEFDETERITTINKPALIISGADDKMTPVRNAQFLADSIPDSKLEIIPDAGHMVMLEKPEAVATVLHNFLDDISYS